MKQRKFLKYLMYLFLERGKGRKKGWGNVDCLPLLCTLTEDWTHNSAMCPGIKPVTFCFVGWCPTTWAIWIRVKQRILIFGNIFLKHPYKHTFPNTWFIQCNKCINNVSCVFRYLENNLRNNFLSCSTSRKTFQDHFIKQIPGIAE